MDSSIHDLRLFLKSRRTKARQEACGATNHMSRTKQEHTRAVIASEAKQSIFPANPEKMDCRAGCAGSQ
jgi:hypothetical protein